MKLMINCQARQGQQLSSVLALLASLAVFSLTPSSHAQKPPDPSYQRQQIFASYQDFKNSLTAAASNPAQLDALWTQLRNAGQVPYAQGNQAALLYRGSATSVSFAG